MSHLLTRNKTYETVHFENVAIKAGRLKSDLSIEDRISARYSGLSERLQAAANYVMQSPIEIATRSLRSVAASSGLAPSTFTRLARALDFDSYEELRELSRDAIGRRAVTFSDKARRLRARDQAREGGEEAVLYQQAAACVQNIEDMSHAIDAAKLQNVVDALGAARRVTLLGSLASYGVVDYMRYLAGWLPGDWSMAEESNAELAAAVADAGPEDAFVLVSKPPFARIVMRAAQLAAERGAFVLVITDTHTCPALEFASASFIVPSDSPHFFSSYVSTMVLVETIMSMLVAQSGEDAEQRIREIESYNQSLGQYWAE